MNTIKESRSQVRRRADCSKEDIIHLEQQINILTDKITALCSRVKSMEIKVDGDHVLLMQRTAPINDIGEVKTTLNSVLLNQATIKTTIRVIAGMIALAGSIFAVVELFIR